MACASCLIPGSDGKALKPINKVALGASEVATLEVDAVGSIRKLIRTEQGPRASDWQRDDATTAPGASPAAVARK